MINQSLIGLVEEDRLSESKLGIESKSKSKQYTMWVLINVFEFLCLYFFSLSARKRGFSLCLCLGFDQRIVVDVCRGEIQLHHEGFSLFGTGLASSESLLRFIFNYQ